MYAELFAEAVAQQVVVSDDLTDFYRIGIYGKVGLQELVSFFLVLWI
ncbi:hypothetical protein ACR777_05610 [Sphingobacterium spiritivorum]